MNTISASSLSVLNRELLRQLASFGAIGVVSTVAYVALYSLAREVAPAAAANAAALVITAIGNTAANRRVTFEVRGRDGLARDHAAGLMAFGAALAMTSASLAILETVAPQHGRLTEVAVLVAANATATLVRFLLLRSALIHRSTTGGSGLTLDRARDARMSTERAPATLSQSERTRG